ncbi:MAG: Gfo/Idh/MocA family oxidoreductase [Chloroflexi bacterium]|nr:Gfo/Idh/MocA family oxidoreductase [Chloroflexota bacterium]
MKKNRLGVAVVGLGVGEQHAHTYAAIDQCELVWLYDLDTNKSAHLSKELRAGAVANSFEQILHDPTVQIVSIASYDDDHFEQVVAALNAGKHVFVEKPLCRTHDEVITIKQAWAKHDGRLKLSTNLVLRAAPMYRWLKQEYDAGHLGKAYAFDGDYLYGRLEKITQGWRKDVDDYSVMLGGGVHLIDLMLWITSELPRQISAVGNRICTTGTDFRFQDYVTAMMQFRSGLVGRITANFGCVHQHQHVIRLFGTKATFLYDDAGARLHISRDPSAPSEPISFSPLPKSKGDLIPPFVSAILNEENLDQHTQTMFDVISVCVACDQATQSGQTVEVQYT